MGTHFLFGWNLDLALQILCSLWDKTKSGLDDNAITCYNDISYNNRKGISKDMIRKLFALFVAVMFVLAFPLTASANSSWHWISSKRPLDLLPIVIIITLVIEVVSINYVAKVNSLKRVIPVVSLANLISFLIPYILLGISPDNVYSIYTSEKGLFYAIDYTVQHSPTFTVSLFYLIITLLVETPIVYLFLREKTPNKKILFIVIISANIITTLITFAVERIFCNGQW